MARFPIRNASIDDVRQLVQFNCAMAGETENIQLDTDVVTAGVAALFEHPERGFYVVADADGLLAGSLMITTEWSDWRNGVFWWLQSVYVRPEYRRRGVYRSLYQFVRSMSEQHPEICGFRLYVERDNRRAQQTYESLGMNQTPYLVYEKSLIFNN
ncbi:MAG: Mycothiol acetyltransferase [Gammaproteobacteria bacterium]|nr:Mycothiol acetyltransferase [Gammaproteobacteria bacterium]